MEDGEGKGDATERALKSIEALGFSEELTEIAPRGVISATQILISHETPYAAQEMPDDNADNNANSEIWPTKFLKPKSDSADLNAKHGDGDIALIILHSPIEDIDYFRRLWSHASFRLCADGAANRLHDVLTGQNPEVETEDALKTALPDAIHGDLDSLDDAVRSRYESLGVEISKDPDQYSTDFGKAVKKVFERLPNVHHVLVLGSIGGRVDQGIGLLGELYREQRFNHPGVRFWLFSEANVSTILSPGITVIHTPLKDGLITRNTGVLSVYGPAKISTQGLEWDVQDWKTEMGGQMSTSNHIMSDNITIWTDTYVLFTVERAGHR
jgi:thiamine pyrophosphokinase